MFLHKSCFRLFLLPLASEQFLIIRKMVFSAMNHQPASKGFELAADSGAAKHSETGLGRCCQSVHVGEILVVVIIISDVTYPYNAWRFIIICTTLHIIIIINMNADNIFIIFYNFQLFSWQVTYLWHKADTHRSRVLTVDAFRGTKQKPIFNFKIFSVANFIFKNLICRHIYSLTSKPYLCCS